MSSYEFSEDGEHLRIVGAAECGRGFDTGRILEPESENPALELNYPLGVNGVQKIVELLYEWRRSRADRCECGDTAFYADTQSTEVQLEAPASPQVVQEDKDAEEWYCCGCGRAYSLPGDRIAILCARAQGTLPPAKVAD